jgi:transposase
LLGVELWAEIRRLKYVEGLSQREIHRRTGVHRDTIRSALASSTPPVYGPRPSRLSKLEPFVAAIEELLREEPTLSGVRVREELEKLGYVGGKTILDDLLRELRPRFSAAAAQLSRSVKPTNRFDTEAGRPSRSVNICATSHSAARWRRWPRTARGSRRAT